MKKGAFLPLLKIKGIKVIQFMQSKKTSRVFIDNVGHDSYG